MERKHNIVSALLLFLLLGVMLLPAVQNRLHLISEKKLEGAVIPATDTILNSDTWFDGSYARAHEKYLNDQFGFRNSMIRLRNEIYYRAYSRVFAKDVVMGKSGFLYELYYLEAHAGLDYIGDAKLKKRFEMLKLVQDSLEKRGIRFLIAFAPGKASYYPEYIPAPYANPSPVTNYFKHVEYAKQYGIHCIDFNAWFMQLKQTMPYPLYPKTGTHWSVYGMHVAFDSLSRYLEKVFNHKMARFDYSKVELSDSLRTPDGDIAEGLNLFSRLPHFKMAYPVLKWTDTTAVFKPRVMVVSDSYWMGIYFLMLPQHSFSKHEFWYYNNQVFNYNPEGKVGKVGDYDLKRKVEGSDAIILVSTEATLKELGWGFIEEVYNMYKNGPAAYANQRQFRKKISELNETKRNIRGTREWMLNLEKESRKTGITVDSLVDQNASYIYTQNHLNDTQSTVPEVNEVTEEDKLLDMVKETVEQIKRDPVWLEAVKKKALERHIPLDSAIVQDARWVSVEEMKKHK
ncbi:MAG: hypothetical protein ACHQRM_13835 [Bacteroidia bacterium]